MKRASRPVLATEFTSDSDEEEIGTSFRIKRAAGDPLHLPLTNLRPENPTERRKTAAALEAGFVAKDPSAGLLALLAPEQPTLERGAGVRLDRSL